MELTPKDKRYIEEQVKKMDMRMKMEATEYAHLCELYYYEKLAERVQMQLEVCQEYPEGVKRVYND